MTVEAKQEEVDNLKRHLKATKMNELEVEMKLYVDECTRLRHLLEEVIKSRDPLADPEEMARIEEQFNQQNFLI